MKIMNTLKLLGAIALGITTFNANANSVGFDQSIYVVNNESRLIVTVNYDFTKFAMFGGGLDLYYDTNVLSLGGYTPADLTDTDAQPAASPMGTHSPNEGLYSGFGIGTFEFFTGMNSSGPIGVFIFDFIGHTGELPDTPCGQLLCLSVNPINPFVSLGGNDVSGDLLGNGISSANIPSRIPVPAAVWFMLSGLGVLGGLRRKS